MISLKNGLQSLSDRMGADLIIVPKEMEKNLKGVILNGEPNTFYLDADIIKSIPKDHIEKMTSQVFVATLTAECCAMPVQAIGIDYDTDFIVKPWLSEKLKEPLKSHEILIGSNVGAAPGDKLSFFDKEYIVRDKLNRTGMGFDVSVFLNMDDAREMARDSAKVVPNPLANNKNLISNILVKVKDLSPRQVSILLNRALKDKNATTFIADNLITDVSSKLKGFFIYIYILLALIWLLSILIISMIFSFIIHERKKEYATLRAIGFTKKSIYAMVSRESLILSCLGAVIGIPVSFVLGQILNHVLHQSFQIPILAPSLSVTLLLVLLSIFISCFVGPLVSVLFVKNIMKEDILLTAVDNE